jgi:hypothetical protein
MPTDKDIVRGLEPDEIVRKSKGHKYFGLKYGALEDAIERGDIPPPVSLTASGRARGWFGRQIIEHQQRRLAAAKQSAA